MIKHVVMFLFKDSAEGLDKAEIIKEARARFEALPEKIQFLETFEVGTNIGSSPVAYDLVLYSEFQNLEKLKDYQVHPAHEEVKHYLDTLKERVAIVDYEV
jgi:hypothetical protein